MQRLLALAGICSLILIPGCTPKSVKVTGRLVKNGQVQTYSEDTYVTLQFVPVEPADGKGRSYVATIDRPHGTYEVELPPGKYRLALFVPPKDYDPSNPQFAPPPGTRSGGGGLEFEFTSDTKQDIDVP